MEKLTTADRLKQIMRERNLKQVDILEFCKPYCEKYGVKLGKNDLSQYISGKVTPGQDKLTILGLALNVNEVWLMGYNLPSGRNDLECIEQRLQDTISSHERDIINAYREQPESVKVAICKMLDVNYIISETQAKKIV